MRRHFEMLATIPPHPGNHAVALHLAALGLYVFPCQGGGDNVKKPCPGVYWINESTLDARRINSWWNKWPDAVPGVDCGKSGLLAIDPDKAEGVAAWLALCEDKPALGEPVVYTPNSGEHHYFRAIGRHGNRRGLLPKGVDVRGKGGYVIGPNAKLLDGRIYELNGDLQNIPDAPEWLIDILTGEKPEAVLAPAHVPVSMPPISGNDDARISAYAQRAVEMELAKVRSCVSGQFNITLNNAALSLGTMAGSGWIGEAAARQWLLSAALDVRPKKRVEALKTINSGVKEGITRPRGPLPDDELLGSELGAEVAANLVRTAAGDLVDAETGEVIEDAPTCYDFPENLTYPGGLVGEITDWITDSARMPSRPMALASALAVLGAAMGREWIGPTESSTTLFTLVLAPTGAGKDHIMEQAGKLMMASGMSDLIGPDDYQSANAMSNFMARHPLSLSIMDEFGAFLNRVTHRNASSFSRDTSAFMRKMWSIKQKPFRTSEYAQKSSTQLFGPAFNILGASAPREFYAALKGADVKNGFFNRFFLVPISVAPTECEPQLSAEPPRALIEKLEYAFSRGRLHDHKRRGDMRPAYVRIPWVAGGHEAHQALIAEIKARTAANEEATDFYARCREMALRIATIVAYGANLNDPAVDGATMEWAAQVALWSTDRMFSQFVEFAAETETQALAKEILRHVRSKPVMTRSDLIRCLDHKYKSAEIEGVVKLLLESGDMETVSLSEKQMAKPGRKSTFYRAPKRR